MSSPVDVLRGLNKMANIPKAPPLTSAKLKHLAGEGLARPSALTAKEVRQLSGALMTRIEPRKKG